MLLIIIQNMKSLKDNSVHVEVNLKHIPEERYKDNIE